MKHMVLVERSYTTPDYSAGGEGSVTNSFSDRRSVSDALHNLTDLVENHAYHISTPVEDTKVCVSWVPDDRNNFTITYSASEDNMAPLVAYARQASQI